MPRSYQTLGISVICLLVLSVVGRAQRIGDFNDARFFSTISAASLGQPVGVSLGLSTSSLSYGGGLAVGDIGLGPGALRLVAAHPKNFQGYALGYGAPVFRRTLAPFVTTTIGAELSVSYLGYRLSGPSIFVGNGTYTNAHLTLPVGLQLGDVNRLSFTPYVAPFAEFGSAPSGVWEQNGRSCVSEIDCQFLYSGHHDSRALGAGLGFRLTAWRVGIDAAFQDLPVGAMGRRDRSSLGFTFRF